LHQINDQINDQLSKFLDDYTDYCITTSSSVSIIGQVKIETVIFVLTRILRAVFNCSSNSDCA